MKTFIVYSPGDPPRTIEADRATVDHCCLLFSRVEQGILGSRDYTDTLIIAFAPGYWTHVTLAGEKD